MELNQKALASIRKYYQDAALEEAVLEQVGHPVTIEGDGRIPVEVLEGVRLGEAGGVPATAEVLLLAALDLVLEGELEEVERMQSGLVGVGGPLEQDGHQAGELESLQIPANRIGLHHTNELENIYPRELPGAIRCPKTS
jgi:hypothetical protein